MDHPPESQSRPNPVVGGDTPSRRPLILVALGILVVLGAVAIAFLMWNDDIAEAPPRAEPAAPEAAAPSPAPAQPPAPEVAAPVGPSFDIVRIDPSGNTVIAGRAAPDSTVVILDDGNEIGRVTADRRGEWVFLPDQPLPSGNRELSLSAIGPDGTRIESEDVVVLAVPETADGRTLALRSGRDGTAPQLMQGAAPLGEHGDLAVDLVDYDDEGRLTITGRAAPGAVVQLYLNTEFLGRTTGDADGGAWTLTPQTRAPYGQHVVRADMLDDDGSVGARVEVPFERLEPQIPDGIRVVVQPGNNLWLLARRIYGEGRSFSVIYDANRGHIRNPDLIYPGQVFIVPDDAVPVR